MQINKLKVLLYKQYEIMSTNNLQKSTCFSCASDVVA